MLKTAAASHDKLRKLAEKVESCQLQRFTWYRVYLNFRAKCHLSNVPIIETLPCTKDRIFAGTEQIVPITGSCQL